MLGLIDDRKVPMKAIEASCVTTVVNKARGTYFSLMGTIMYFFANISVLEVQRRTAL